MEVVASLSQGRTAAAQCGLFTYKSVPVIFEPPCICRFNAKSSLTCSAQGIVNSNECFQWCVSLHSALRYTERPKSLLPEHILLS